MNTTTSRPAGRSRREAASLAARVRPGLVMAVIAGATAAALALRCYQLSRPGYLLGVTQYDDGPYFGSAVRLVHGIVPYRDFVMVQPPVITLVMTPAALVSKLTGTAVGMAIGRVLTSLASAAAVTLTGLLVRHRGLLAVTVAGTIMAVYPANLVAAHTVLVEPWVVLFTLAGAVTLFDGDRLAVSRRRLAWGGAFTGLAGATEAWAVFPFVVLLALAIPAAAPSGRFRRARLIGAGAVAGFALPVLPFAVAAPRGLYRSVVQTQVGRVVPAPVSLWHRLRLMTGLGQLFHLSNGTVLGVSAGVAAFVIATTAAAWVITRRPPPPLDAFALSTGALVITAFCWYPQFFVHFPAFLAPFLALSLALPVSRLVTAARTRLGRRAPGWGWAAAGAALAVIAAGTVAQAGSSGTARPRVQAATIAAARRIIPAGACVATDQVSYLLAADRFSSDVPGCSPMVDGLATDYAFSHGRDGDTGAGRYPAVARAWRAEFSHARYAWLSVGMSKHRIAWTPALRRYFRRHFKPVFRDGNHRDVLYVRKHRH